MKKELIANMNFQMENIVEIVKQLDTEMKRINESNISVEDIKDIVDFLSAVEVKSLAATGWFKKIIRRQEMILEWN